MFKILVVENEKQILSNYKQIINTFFQDQVECDFIETKEKAIKKIIDHNSNYMGAIIDLRLDSAETNKQDGNDILHHIKDNLRFPIFVLSAVPDEVDNTLMPKTDLFQVCGKNTEEGEFKTIIERIIAINKTGITTILSKTGKIEQQLQNVFWKHLSQTMSFWIKEAQLNPQETEKALLRYTLSHLQEYLEQTEQGSFEDYYPIEFYINPPIKPKIFTGDILKKDSTHFIVLTPACDFSNNKAKNIVLIEIENVDDALRQTKEQVKKTFIKDIRANNKYQKYHYLPSAHDLDESCINFQRIHTVQYDSTNGTVQDYTKQMTVTAPFLKDIIARFSHYYARQGQPSLKR
jgi:CheY-like chemotaxis protein